jgi:hypothetical protein
MLSTFLPHNIPGELSASRKRSTIEKTIGWIESHLNGKKQDILDLGCGPPDSLLNYSRIADIP